MHAFATRVHQPNYITVRLLFLYAYSTDDNGQGADAVALSLP